MVNMQQHVTSPLLKPDVQRQGLTQIWLVNGAFIKERACLGNYCHIEMPFYPASISYCASTAIRDVPLLYSSVNQGTVYCV